MATDIESDPLEGFYDWEEFDSARDVAPADYGFAESCTGESEEAAG